MQLIMTYEIDEKLWGFDENGNDDEIFELLNEDTQECIDNAKWEIIRRI